MDQLNPFIFESGSFSDQVTIDLSSYLYNTTHKGASLLSPDYYIAYDHLKITMVFVYIYYSGDGLFIFAPSGEKPSICVDSCLS